MKKRTKHKKTEKQDKEKHFEEVFFPFSFEKRLNKLLKSKDEANEEAEKENDDRGCAWTVYHLNRMKKT
jgi:hypothetical protein